MTKKFLIYKHINGENRARIIFDNKEEIAIDACENNPYVQDYDIVEADSSQDALEKAKSWLHKGLQTPLENSS